MHDALYMMSLFRHCTRVPAQLPGLGERKYQAISLTGHGDCTISLQQASMRGRWEPDRLADFALVRHISVRCYGCSHTMKVLLFRTGNHEPWRYAKSSPLQFSEQVFPMLWICSQGFDLSCRQSSMLGLMHSVSIWCA